MTNQPDGIEQIKALIAEFIAASNVGSLEFNQRLQQQEETRERDRFEFNQRLQQQEEAHLARMQQQEEAHLARIQQQEATRERERQELDRRLEQERFEFNQRLQQQEEARLARMQQQEAIRERERQELDRRFKELEQLTRSNAIAIQALTDDLVTFKLATEQANQEIKSAVLRLTDVTEGIAHLVSSLDDRPTILRKLNSIENKIDRVLERNRSNDELQ